MNRLTKTEKSWVLYDWANSVYATIIMAAIFPIYFSSVAAAEGMAGDVYWGYVTSIATFIVAVSAPILGAIGDFAGFKKKMFTGFLITGLLFTLVMAVTDHPMLMLVGYGISYVGFAGSNLFYDSFLTDVTTKENMDKVSSFGYAMGYLGGSTIPFVISITLILFADALGIGNAGAVKISVVLTVVWWSVFSVPMLRNVKQIHHIEKPQKSFLREVFANLGKTVKKIAKDKGLLLFIIAYFFYIDGVGTVIHMATSYGSTLGLSSTGMILALLLTQIIAVPCSILFSRFSQKIGTIKMLLVGISVYIVVCLVGFYMGFSLEPHQFEYEREYKLTADAAIETASLSDEAGKALYKSGFSVLPQKDRADAFADSAQKLASDFPDEDSSLRSAAEIINSFLNAPEKSAAYDAALSFSSILFWVLSVFVGTSQGGMQALSRSHFGKVIPAERSNEFFGFFDIFGKFASVIGPALYAAFAHATGRSSIGILSLAMLFILGGVTLFIQRKFSGNGEAAHE